MDLKKTLAGIVMVGVMVTGVGATAAYADGATGPKGPVQRVGRLHRHKVDCSKVAQYEARLQKAVTVIQKHLDRLAKLKAKADAAGKTDLSNRIQQRIDKLNNRLARITSLEQKLQQKCSGTPSGNQ